MTKPLLSIMCWAAITQEAKGETVISGPAPDHAALFDLLMEMHELV